MTYKEVTSNHIWAALDYLMKQNTHRGMKKLIRLWNQYRRRFPKRQVDLWNKKVVPCNY